MREKWTNLSGNAVNNSEKDRCWIGFHRLILRNRAFILPILNLRQNQVLSADQFAAQDPGQFSVQINKLGTEQ